MEYMSFKNALSIAFILGLIDTTYHYLITLFFNSQSFMLDLLVVVPLFLACFAWTWYKFAKPITLKFAFNIALFAVIFSLLNLFALKIIQQIFVSNTMSSGLPGFYRIIFYVAFWLIMYSFIIISANRAALQFKHPHS